ncbi:two-component system response regulator [candidate division KSB3 bacterium]|uniref:Two-component system response regulator n=1 Tax=candidate division KSB3 bacterium TaxID=2044937 RepID=A0A2G6E547_9BACT|nr:MAG: two-component system response regulator [candidate division KSB3 bacterium]PIE29701.1 MAG: two-component system response regulator [candidate division KSB3 bacterium]
MKTILIVDDEKHIRFLYEEEFSDAGYKTLTASNGLEAFERLKEHQEIDLILLDIKMPQMDGTEFLRRIRKVNKEIPILLSTAYGDYVQQDFSAWLSNGYTVKTSDLSELKAKVKALLGE